MYVTLHKVKFFLFVVSTINAIRFRDPRCMPRVHKWNAFFCEVYYKRSITGLRSRKNLSLIANMT